jgi:prepilin-type N-terminal cleavage/methylation domain-containing protein
MEAVMRDTSLALQGPATHRGRRPGMTLMEVMIAMVMMALVLGAAMSFFVGQSQTYSAAAKAFNQVQNVRYGADLLDQHLRAAGANTTPGQPPLVYMSPTAFSFNADYASADSGTTAIYYTPGAPALETQGVLSADQFPLPGVTPAYIYPTVDYSLAPGIPSPAELITFWFQVDSTATEPGVYALYREVNNGTVEAVVRNILPDTVPFFQYYKLVTNPVTGLQSLTLVTPGELPASYTSTLMIDSIRAVQVTYRVTNGDTGSAQRIQSFSLTSALPNLVSPELETCGNSPQPVPSVTADTGGTFGMDSVVVSWPPSPDEWGGERDIMRYIVWRRLATDSTWNAPFTSEPNGQLSYTFVDLTAPDTIGVEYAVSAQDCTPSFSTPVSSNMVTPP